MAQPSSSLPERTLGTHWVGSSVVPKAGLVTLQKRKICCLLASKQTAICYVGASSWFYYRNNITMHGPTNVKKNPYFPLQHLSFLSTRMSAVLCKISWRVHSHQIIGRWLFHHSKDTRIYFQRRPTSGFHSTMWFKHAY